MSAANLALAQAHLAGNTTLLADFDFRRPIVHTLFGVDRSPGITDYLLGRVPLHQAMRKIAGTNLYIMPAGEAVINPLELLNLREVKLLLDRLPTLFNWIILDSPPLLFAADANLLSTLCHGTLLVVRIGHTTIDSVTRAMQSLCNNNVLGIVVNGARRGELYSKYTYYHSYYTPKEEDEKKKLDEAHAEGTHEAGHALAGGTLGLGLAPEQASAPVAVAEPRRKPHRKSIRRHRPQRRIIAQPIAARRLRDRASAPLESRHKAAGAGCRTSPASSSESLRRRRLSKSAGAAVASACRRVSGWTMRWKSALSGIIKASP